MTSTSYGKAWACQQLADPSVSSNPYRHRRAKMGLQVLPAGRSRGGGKSFAHLEAEAFFITYLVWDEGVNENRLSSPDNVEA